MIRDLQVVMSSLKGLNVDSAILENNSVEDLVQKGGISRIDLPKTARMPSAIITIDTRELYRNMMESDKRAIRMVASCQSSYYYGIDAIGDALGELYEGICDQVTFRHAKVVKVREKCSAVVDGFYLNPVFRDLEMISKATKRSFTVHTADGEKFSARNISFLPTMFFKAINSESVELFNKLVKMVNDVREDCSVRSIYFTGSIELAYEYYMYHEALLARDVVESKTTYSTFDSIHIADDGVYLRDDSDVDGQPFLLFIPFDLFKKVYDEHYYDDFEEEKEYIDYVDSDGSEDFDDGNHENY